MKLIVGLGNPGEKYENTPHNAGFIFVDALREFLGWDSGYDVHNWTHETQFDSMVCRIKPTGASETAMILLKPQVFMNLSGRAVGNAVRKLDIEVADDMILVHDDLDISLGEFKIQKGKAPKNHKGVSSVESVVAVRDFWRVRVGVESREDRSLISGEEFVIREMDEETRTTLDETVVDAIKQCRKVMEF